MRPGRQISVRSTLAIARHFPIPWLYGSPRNRSLRTNHGPHSRSCTGRRWDRSSEPILRRSGHSFIWDWLVSSLTTATTIPSSSLQTSKLDDTKLEGERGKEEERTLYRYSMVHAHPLGPWEAILSAVKRHYYNDMNQTAYHILDVGCGPRGQPGTTIANALPLVSVHCIDSCHGAIRAVPIRSIHPIMISPFVKIDTTTRFIMSRASAPPMSFVQIPLTPLPLLSSISPMLPPPSNLIKSICNMDNLSQRFLPNSVHVIVSCFGYGSSSSNNNSNDSANATTLSETDQILSSLRQAYDTLLPGGILILCTWQYSSLLALSHDMNITLQHGCGDSAAMIRVQHQNHIDEGAVRNDISSSSSSSSSSGSRRYPKIQYSDTDEWEDLLYQAGFQKPDQIQSSIHTYPICLGKTPRQQFNFSTLLIPLDVQEYYNNNNNSYQTWSDCFNTATQKSSATSSGYRNNTEEAFWMNVMEHTDPSNTGCTSQTNDNDPHCHDPNVDTSMWMPKNIFKLTIATK